MPLHCELCQQTCSTPSSLRRHVSSKHSNNIQQHGCPNCPDKVYRRADDLLKHVRKKHSNLSDPTPAHLSLPESAGEPTTASSVVRTGRSHGSVDEHVGQARGGSAVRPLTSGREKSSSTLRRPPEQWCEVDTDPNIYSSPSGPPATWHMPDFRGPMANTYADDDAASSARSKRVYEGNNTTLVIPRNLEDLGITPISCWPKPSDALPPPPAYVLNAVARLEAQYTRVSFSATMIPYATFFDGQKQTLWLSCPPPSGRDALYGTGIKLVPTITCSCCPGDSIIILKLDVAAVFRTHTESPAHVKRAIVRLQKHMEYPHSCATRDAINSIIEGQDISQLTPLLVDLGDLLTTPVNDRLLRALDEICLAPVGSSLLTLAIRENDLEAVRYLLKSGVNCHSADRSNHTALHWACRHKFLAAAKMLIEHDPSTVLDQDIAGYKAFDIALQTDKSLAYELFASNIPNFGSGASAYYALYHYADHKDFDVFLENRKSVRDPVTDDPETIHAAHQRLLQLRQYELQEALRASLHAAPAKVVENLLQAGASLDANFGRTFIVVPLAHEKWVLLLKHGQIVVKNVPSDAVSMPPMVAERHELDGTSCKGPYAEQAAGLIDTGHLVPRAENMDEWFV